MRDILLLVQKYEECVIIEFINQMKFLFISFFVLGKYVKDEIIILLFAFASERVVTFFSSFILENQHPGDEKRKK
ncbi:MAG: hypothetical protein EAZ74_07100 [Alphaproteobacteria bacterium]|nr:MAG: hypothetical protein EAZ74_07100 [Alphaproteobacteria bacterium]